MGFNSGFKGLTQEIFNFTARRQRSVKCSIPVSFDFITTWNQAVFLCSPCITKRRSESLPTDGLLQTW